MKKSYFWGLLLAIMALIPSQNAFAEYCTMSSTFSNSDRHLDSFTLTDGVEELAVSSVQPNSGSNWWPSYKVYNDHTSKSLTTQPGATLYFKSLSWTGSWMHGYVFIDYNQDETFDASEAVSYNFYSEAGTDTGVNSKGESVSNNCGVTAGSMPSWTLPTDLASGTYRLRLKIDWNSLDACGASDIVTNRGCIADITLNVEAAIPERTIDVTVTPEGAGTVTGAGTAMGNISLVATPTPGYEFVNWTLNGEVVSTEMSYTDATEGNKSYVANFAALTAYPEMSYFYTNGANQANRYLKEVVATAGETVTTVFSATTEAELPKVDPDVIGSATTQGAYVDKTENPIIIPEGTTEFTVNFKAWTAAMTISGESATTQLQWTQQAAFIDWNNNFCFYEEGENYGKSSDTMGNDGGVCQSFISETGYTRTFSVPAGVQPGVYRMRVCYFEPDGNNAQQWQNTIFEKGNCTTRNGKTYDFAIEVIGVTPETPVYAVSVSTADEAMGTAEVSATEVEEGTEVTFTATAAEGYQFVNWTSGEEVVSTENPYTVAVTAEMALTANFELIPVTKYAVSVATADEAMGTAEVSATEVEEGTEVTFTATAAEGYQFVNWTSGEEVVSTENPYTVAVTAEMTLTANFELIPVTKYAVSVTTVDGAMGTAEVSATEVKEGEEVTFTATANLGYKFIGWLANGETVSTENPYTTAVTTEMSLVANFEALTPAIVLTATPDVERQFVFEVAKAAKILIDWGDGNLVETEEIGETYPGTEWIGYYKTTVNGTVKGEGEVKIYGDITYFDCSYSSSYSSKVTSLDVTNATSLLELNASSNEITTLDLSNNTALYDLALDNNTLLTSLILPSEGQLNSISALSCALTTLDLTSSTSLTSLVVNDNPGLGSLDLSANTALTQLKANNTGLTAIDLSANTALNALYLNNNQLTTLDVSKMDKGAATRIYVYAKSNNLTEFITSEQVLLSSTRIYIDGNAFTLATLPAITGINAYNYAPQQAMTIATEITEGEELDLSSQAMVGENATVYTWYTAEGEEFTNYTVEGGKFVFDVEADTELYCTMTNASFDKFSGANAFKTTNILVKYVAPTTYTVTVTVTTFDGGTVAIQGYEGETAQIEEGTQVTVVATPAEGFEFVSWTDADDAWDTDLTFNAEYTFTVTRDINLKAWFSQLPVVTTCQVLVNIAPTEDYGTVVIEGVEGLLAEVEVGTEVTAVATPAEGKIFEGWFTFEGDELSTNATYTFTATEDVVVVAWFTDAPEPDVPMTEGGIELTFTKVSATESTVAVAGTDVNVDGITASVTSNYAWKALNLETEQYFSAESILCPDKNSNAMTAGSEAEFTIVLNNVPAGYKFGNVTFTSVALNGGGAWQGDPAEESQVTFTLMNEDGDELSKVENKPIKIDSFRGGSLAIPFAVENYYSATDGTLTLKLKLEKGAVNNGCFYGLIKVQIETLMPTGIEDEEVEAAAQVYGANGAICINGYEGNVKVVNTSGQVVKDVNVNGNEQLNVNAGLYIVVTGNQVTKVVVK